MASLVSTICVCKGSIIIVRKKDILVGVIDHIGIEIPKRDYQRPLYP